MMMMMAQDGDVGQGQRRGREIRAAHKHRVGLAGCVVGSSDEGEI